MSSSNEAGGWKPIETAPKDGTYILAPYPIWEDSGEGNEYETTIVYWSLLGGWASPIWGLLQDIPSHWMDLPIFY